MCVCMLLLCMCVGVFVYEETHLAKTDADTVKTDCTKQQSLRRTFKCAAPIGWDCLGDDKRGGRDDYGWNRINIETAKRT